MRSGKLKILAVLEPTRYPGLPDVPSINEAVPSFQKPPSWFGFFGPARLPKPVLDRLNAELVRALHEPDIRSKFDDAALAVIGNMPEQFAAMLRSAIEQYGRIMKAAGIEPE